MNISSRRLTWASIVLVCLCGPAAFALYLLAFAEESTAGDPAVTSNAPASEPRYTDRGELRLPEGYEDWIFVGSNLGLEYKEDGADAGDGAAKPDALRNFHNVYINPEAYSHFRKTGAFPDKTVLVLDVYSVERGDGKTLVSQGLFPGKQQEIAVAVKNSARKDGSTTDWAYYDFPAGTTVAKAFPDKQCYQCHLDHGSVDNVFVQFYPTLRKLHTARAAK